jgi:hypothetical protein
MNIAIKRISARNAHERLALRRPRDELRNLADTATLTANARAQGDLSIEIHFPLIPFAMPR